MIEYWCMYEKLLLPIRNFKFFLTAHIINIMFSASPGPADSNSPNSSAGFIRVGLGT